MKYVPTPQNIFKLNFKDVIIDISNRPVNDIFEISCQVSYEMSYMKTGPNKRFEPCWSLLVNELKNDKWIINGYLSDFHN